MNKILTIGEAAVMCGVNIATLRKWEQKNQLVSKRTSTKKHRTYSYNDVKRFSEERNKSIIGQVFYPWYVVETSTDTRTNGIKLWNVKCENCGYETSKSKYEIKSSNGCRNCSLLKKGESGLNNLFVTYRNNAKKTNREFSLSVDQFTKLTGSICYYCGLPPTKIFTCNKNYIGKLSVWGNYKFNGIDRLDNDIGYVFYNCVACCHICNRAKNSMLTAEFVAHIKTILDNGNTGNIPCLSQYV